MTIAPTAGVCIVSLVVDGDELLALPAPLAEFLAAERTGGIPLLYPWANRLRGDDPVVLGRVLATRGARLCHRDGNGLPLHGLLLRWPRWSIDECRADEGSALFAASLDWARHEELMRAFPFPHRLSVRFDLTPQRLEITTRVEAHNVEVPVSFGWHPCLRLATPSAPCAVRLPARRELPLDARRLPVAGASGVAVAVPIRGPACGAICDRTLRDAGRIATRRRLVVRSRGAVADEFAQHDGRVRTARKVEGDADVSPVLVDARLDVDVGDLHAHRPARY